MKKDEILKELRIILDNDNDNYDENKLFNNISNSTGSTIQLSESFNIPSYLVLGIMDIR